MNKWHFEMKLVGAHHGTLVRCTFWNEDSRCMEELVAGPSAALAFVFALPRGAIPNHIEVLEPGRRSLKL